MDDDWDAEDFVPPPPSIAREQPKSQWDDEDAEDDDIKESWEDEDKPKPEVASVAAPGSQKAKAAKKTAIENKGKASASQDEAVKKLSDKLQQQRLVEEADYQSTTELFGKRAGDKTLDNFIPKSEDDFLEYAELVAHYLRPYEKSFHYLVLLKTVMRHSMTSLKAADAKEVASSVTIIANEKLKAEKEATAGKKKTGPKKKQLHVDKPDDDGFAAPYDDVDEYDFM